MLVHKWIVHNIRCLELHCRFSRDFFLKSHRETFFERHSLSLCSWPLFQSQLTVARTFLPSSPKTRLPSCHHRSSDIPFLFPVTWLSRPSTYLFPLVFSAAVTWTLRTCASLTNLPGTVFFLGSSAHVPMCFPLVPVSSIFFFPVHHPSCAPAHHLVLLSNCQPVSALLKYLHGICLHVSLFESLPRVAGFSH